jgi:hypothetical protein
MDYPNIKIPIFSENPADFQEWKIDFITGIGLRKLRHMIDENEPTHCPSILDKNSATPEQKVDWEKNCGASYRKWKADAKEIYTSSVHAAAEQMHPLFMRGQRFRWTQSLEDDSLSL